MTGCGVRDRGGGSRASREAGLEAGAGSSVAPRVQALGAGRGMSVWEPVRPSARRDGVGWG